MNYNALMDTSRFDQAVIDIESGYKLARNGLLELKRIRHNEHLKSLVAAESAPKPAPAPPPGESAPKRIANLPASAPGGIIETSSRDDFAVNIVARWEGMTYTWHGAPHRSAFGLLGWEKDELHRMARMFQVESPSQIGAASQRNYARDYFNKMLVRSANPRGITDLLAQACSLDMYVNNGKYHPYFAFADRKFGWTDAAPPNWEGYEKKECSDDGRLYMQAVNNQRILRTKKKQNEFPGLEKRYMFWRKLLMGEYQDDEKVYIPDKNIFIAFPPPERRKPGLAFGSPVSASASAASPPRWTVSAGCGWQFPPTPYFEKAMHYQLHAGADLNGAGWDEVNEDITLVADGRIIFAGFAGEWWGYVVIAEHDLGGGDKAWSIYAHTNPPLVEIGAVLRRGAILATIAPGAKWSTHLHFAISRVYPLDAAGKFVMKSFYPDMRSMRADYHDPISFINARGHWKLAA